MIAWVHANCRTWGKHFRWKLYGDYGWPSRSQLGRLIEEGPGASHGEYGSVVLAYDDPPAYVSVSVAMQKMAATHEMERPWMVVHAHYVYSGRVRHKAEELGISIPTYWSQLHAAHAFIAACDVPRETILSRQLAQKLA